MKSFYKDKRVLVTGHSGFKGSWLTQWLVDMGAEVAGLSLYLPSKPSLFEGLDLSRSIENFEVDIRNHKQLTKAINSFNPEIIFHLAAQPIVLRSYKEPRDTMETNIMGTINVLEAIRQSASTKVGVIITTDKVYENKNWLYGYRESDTLGGKDPYSASKAAAEITTSAYHRSFFQHEDKLVVTTRAGNVIGGGDWGENRIVPDCITAWAKGEEVTLRNPRATRPWQHVLEPLSGYLWLATQLYKNHDLAGEGFNFGPDAEEDQSVESLVKELQGTWKNAKWKTNYIEKEAQKEAGLLRLSCDKATQLLGWRPCLSFEETAKMTATWYKEYYESPKVASEMTKSQIKNYTHKAKERGIVWA